MSSLLEPKTGVTMLPPFPDGVVEERLADYLDHLCAPLIGIVPIVRRQDIRAEAGAHLYALIDEHIATGMSPLAATEAALQAYGPPYQVGRSILDTWYRGAGSKTSPSRYLRFAVARAFACFSLPSALCYLVIANYSMGAIGEEHIPLLLLFVCLTPIFAGALTGWLVPTRSAQVVVYAVEILVIHGVLTGVTLLPHTEGLWLALFQLVYWLPAGACAAYTTQALRCHYLRTSFRPQISR